MAHTRPAAVAVGLVGYVVATPVALLLLRILLASL
jgi:hypothetical protein